MSATDTLSGISLPFSRRNSNGHFEILKYQQPKMQQLFHLGDPFYHSIYLHGIPKTILDVPNS